MEKIDRINKLKYELVNTIIDSHAYNHNNQFINIDHLWQDPKWYIKSSKQISEFISLKINTKEISSIISVDNIIFPYGPIPLASHVAADLSLPFGIWKEFDNPITGENQTFGNLSSQNSLLFYDVTRFGLSALRMVTNLHIRGIDIRWFFVLVDSEQGAGNLLMSNSNNMGFKIEFCPLITLSEILNFYNSNVIMNKT